MQRAVDGGDLDDRIVRKGLLATLAHWTTAAMAIAADDDARSGVTSEVEWGAGGEGFAFFFHHVTNSVTLLLSSHAREKMGLSDAPSLTVAG